MQYYISPWFSLKRPYRHYPILKAYTYSVGYSARENFIFVKKKGGVGLGLGWNMCVMCGIFFARKILKDVEDEKNQSVSLVGGCITFFGVAIKFDS